MSTIERHAYADVAELDACLDRIGCPKADPVTGSMDRNADDDAPRPSLAFRLGWLEGHVRAQSELFEAHIGLLQAVPALERVATCARAVLRFDDAPGDLGVQVVNQAAVRALDDAIAELERVHMTFLVEGEEQP